MKEGDDEDNEDDDDDEGNQEEEEDIRKQEIVWIVAPCRVDNGTQEREERERERMRAPSESTLCVGLCRYI